MKKNTSKKSNKTFLSKHYPLLIILALLVLLVASVSILLNLRNNAPIESDDDYVTVPGGPDGFYASDQVAFGGDSVSNVSINSVQMTAEEDALCITLDFKEENNFLMQFSNLHILIYEIILIIFLIQIKQCHFYLIHHNKA